MLSPPCGRRSEVRRFAQPNSADTYSSTSIKVPQGGPARPTVKRPDLTLRQQQLVGLVAKGLTNKEIASRLNISEYTVKNHVRRIMKRVDAVSRSQAVEAIRSHGYSLNSYGGTA